MSDRAVPAAAQQSNDSSASGSGSAMTRSLRRSQVHRANLDPIEISLTVTMNGKDIDDAFESADLPAPLDLFAKWAKINCDAALFALERGERDAHLHMQGVMKVRIKSAAECLKRIRSKLGLRTRT